LSTQISTHAVFALALAKAARHLEPRTAVPAGGQTDKRADRRTDCTAQLGPFG
jgi:hypothetical protein